MDVREKLVGLIAKAKYICANDYSDHTEDEYIADTLLDNGVTVQEWIPVAERLPEDDHDVLIVGSGNPVKNVRLENSLEIARFSKDDGWILECWPDWETPIVTHWMPLPEPPKEEKDK